LSTKITREDIDKTKILFKVEIDFKEFEKDLIKGAEGVSKDFNYKGFRPGKLPLDMVRQTVGDNPLIQAGVKLAVPRIYQEIISEHKIIPAGSPTVDVTQAKFDLPLILELTIEVLPEIELPDLSKIKVEKERPRVGDENLDKVLETIRRQHADLKPSEEPIAWGDWAEIDFEGSIAGVPFEGGSSKNHPLVVGEADFIPGFEEQLVGLKKGAEKEFKIIFPATYHVVNLAAKKAKFKVKVGDTKKINLPELSDALAKKMGAKDLADLKEKIKTDLKQRAEREAELKFQNDVIETIIKKVDPPVPQGLVDQEAGNLLHQLEHRVGASGVPFDKYLESIKKSKEDLLREFRPQAELRAKSGMVIGQYAKSEKLQVTEGEIKAEIARLKKSRPAEAAKIEEYYGKPEGEAQLKNILLHNKAVEGIIGRVRGAS